MNQPKALTTPTPRPHWLPAKDVHGGQEAEFASSCLVKA